MLSTGVGVQHSNGNCVGRCRCNIASSQIIEQKDDVKKHLSSGVDGSMLHTPVAFIIFNRPDTTERVFAEIAKVRPASCSSLPMAHAPIGLAKQRSALLLVRSLIKWIGNAKCSRTIQM